VSRSYLFVLAAAALCYAALGAVLRILPDHVGGDLGGSAAAVGFAVGAPALTAIVLRPLGGRWADRAGPRPLVLAGALVMAAGVVPALGGSSLVALDVSRLVVGAGEGAMMAAAVLWLLRLAGPERRGRALGHIGLANYAGLALGPLLAVALSTDPHRVFLAAIALPLVGALAVSTLHEPHVEGSDPSTAKALHARESADEAQMKGSDPSLLGATLRPGAGLALVNVGYVAVIAFGATVARDHGAGAAGMIVPLFAVTVIGARVLAASVPDRVGAVATLRCCVVAEGLGLVALAALRGSAAALAATVVLAAGQALAVPALGLLALQRVAPARHGAAAGLFFSWFDAGVGLGGPLVGLVARAFGPPAAVALAGAAVLSVWPVVVPGRRTSQRLRLEVPGTSSRWD
jgi:predicted MFS family arabinose efflux permease